MTKAKTSKTDKKKVKLPRSISRMYPNVITCVDATKPVEVSVNRRDCKMAKRLNPSECALAQAARRELKVDGVIIGMSTSYIIKGDQAIRYATPLSVSREIVSFDRHQDFAPGDYYLIPASPARRYGVRHNHKGGKSKIAKRKHHQTARVRVLPKGI
jgi:hypothetical protein